MLRPSLALLVLVALAACDAVGPVNAPPPPPPVEPMPLATLLAEDGRFDAFAALVRETGLTGGATTLAPDDEAFSLMSPESLTGLRRLDLLDKIARRHVLTAPLDPASLSDGDRLQTLEGTPIDVRIDDEGTVFLAGARLDVQVGTTPQGPVYRLKRVLRDHLTVQERIASAPLLARSAALYPQLRLDLSQPATYLIPVDFGYERAPGGVAAFTRPENASLVDKTLRALIVPGEALTASQLLARGTLQTAQGTTLRIAQTDGFITLGSGEGRIVASDIQADGSIIHLIDVPPQEHLTVAERIAFIPQLGTFAAMLQRSGLLATLGGDGPFTVFAPLDTGIVDSLGARGRTALVAEPALRETLSRFHIVPADVPASALVNGASFATLSDQAIVVRPDPVRGGVTAISRALPTQTLDLPARNGRLHLVHSLLNPELSPFDQLVLSGFGTFRAVAERANYRALLESRSTLTIAGPRTVSEQYLQPGFECRARQLVEDHVAAGATQYTPRTAGFGTLGGGTVLFQGTTSLGLVQGEEELGSSPVLFLNDRLRDGGILHGVQGRLRWYAPNGPAQNLPPC